MPHTWDVLRSLDEDDAMESKDNGDLSAAAPAARNLKTQKQWHEVPSVVDLQSISERIEPDSKRVDYQKDIAVKIVQNGDERRQYKLKREIRENCKFERLLKPFQ